MARTSSRNYPDWVKLHIDAFDASQRVDDMTDEELGAYLRLLLRQYRMGGIPADGDRRYRLMRNPSLWPALSELFPPHPDDPKLLANPKAYEVRKESMKRISDAHHANDEKKRKRAEREAAVPGGVPGGAPPGGPGGEGAPMPPGGPQKKSRVEKSREDTRAEETPLPPKGEAAPKAQRGKKPTEDEAAEMARAAFPSDPDLGEEAARKWHAYRRANSLTKPWMRSTWKTNLAKWPDIALFAAAVDFSSGNEYQGLILGGSSTGAQGPSRGKADQDRKRAYIQDLARQAMGENPGTKPTTIDAEFSTKEKP